MATLYLVSTPIGNLGDITYRAVEVLRGVGRVVAEDTRRTRLLLRHYGIGTPVTSAHAHNEARRAQLVSRWLGEGLDVALVSDAGTPLVSDPGARIVAAALSAGHRVAPIPGASAVLAALVASGLPFGRFSFLGFLPRGGAARARLLDAVATTSETAVLFEAPDRLLALLEDLAERCGGERCVAVARELTKVHEEFFRGTLDGARRYYEEVAPRGEVTVVVEGTAAEREPDAADQDAGCALARVLLAQGKRPSAVARELTRRLGIPRNRAYELVHSLPEDRPV
ncbi:MAG: 16S rRNA (cytidine(1402)-2'-O)-methyltransferase [Gemmatimonadetes bacterium]|nr:16S rRNA (cytidine(1402)-2'-O)-methyltransferase [Gemmatimonadota bacterium]